MSRKTVDGAREGGLPSRALFASLGAAKKAGWVVRTSNAGPSDWVHYSAFIYHEARGISEYLVSEKADWERPDAKRHALEWINDHQANAGVLAHADEKTL